jgi:hypothetical protein
MFAKRITQSLAGALRISRRIQEASKKRPYLLLVALLGFFFLALLIPFSRGEAQTSEWTPAWVDFSDPGVIHVVGLDADTAIQLESPISSASPDPDKSGLMAAISQFFSSFAQPLNTPSRATAGWEMIFSDDLEGSFPGDDWSVYSSWGNYLWAQKDCRPYEGSYSAWAVGGVREGGEPLNCGDNYPDGMWSNMVYGPFSLADATAAEFRFMYWLNCEKVIDSTLMDLLFVGASVNGMYFHGMVTDDSVDWTERIFDLTNVLTLGDLTGEPQVWVNIAFSSNYEINYPEGAYVDNIELRKYVGDEPTTTPIPASSTVYLPLVIRIFP